MKITESPSTVSRPYYADIVSLCNFAQWSEGSCQVYSYYNKCTAILYKSWSSKISNNWMCQKPSEQERKKNMEKPGWNCFHSKLFIPSLWDWWPCGACLHSKSFEQWTANGLLAAASLSHGPTCRGITWWAFRRLQLQMWQGNATTLHNLLLARQRRIHFFKGAW